MSMGMVIEETMSGWLQLNDEKAPRDFSFTIRAFTATPLRLTAPRPFRGVVTLAGVEVPVEGTLTIRLTGPAYVLDFVHPEFGALHASGEKTYALTNLVASLTTCPLTVFRDGIVAGHAEVVYRDSMLSFPFKAVKLASADKAFGRF
jgi:hypothetical protein